MYQTILTPEGFNKGMNLYFERHDGSAVTCDDFLAAMAAANNKDLSQFARWYSTPGTPVVKYTSQYNEENRTFKLTLTQESKSDQPLHIPVSVGLLDKTTGEEVVPTTVLELTEAEQTFTFDGLQGDVVPSILRDFSAPVKLEPRSGSVDEESLAFLAARDTDGFNRWEAGQRLYSSLIFQTLKGEQSETSLKYVYEAFSRTLLEESPPDLSIQAYALMLPTESTLAEEMEVIDPIGISKARGEVKKAIARKFEGDLRNLYDKLTDAMAKDTEFKVDATSIGRRRLRNVLLDYLCSIRDTEEEQVAAADLAMVHFKRATGMTDKMAGLSALASMDGMGASARDEAIQEFYEAAEGMLNRGWMSLPSATGSSIILTL
jgi:aminopeptidase N